MIKLTENQILEELISIDGWLYENNALHTRFEFSNFKECFSVMTRIAFEAERINHHPDWSNCYNTLNITLTTHELGGVSEKDITLAKIIEEIMG